MLCYVMLCYVMLCYVMLCYEAVAEGIFEIEIAEETVAVVMEEISKEWLKSLVNTRLNIVLEDILSENEMMLLKDLVIDISVKVLVTLFEIPELITELQTEGKLLTQGVV